MVACMIWRSFWLLRNLTRLSFTSSKVAVPAGFLSVTLMTWKPNLVFTGVAPTVFTFWAKAASENSGTMRSLGK